LKQIQITLAAARVNAGFTQEEAAEKLSVTRNTIINWEKGKVTPRIPEMEMLAKVYSIPVDYIFLPKNSTKSRQK
jgi:DNA-binding XRE family transcriptional regulator